jgi:hypothetical protein
MHFSLLGFWIPEKLPIQRELPRLFYNFPLSQHNAQALSTRVAQIVKQSLKVAPTLLEHLPILFPPK